MFMADNTIIRAVRRHCLSEKDGSVYLAINEADPLLYDPVDAVSIFELE